MNYDNIQLNSLHTFERNMILYGDYTVYAEHEITGERAFILGLITRQFLHKQCGQQRILCWPHLDFEDA